MNTTTSPFRPATLPATTVLGLVSLSVTSIEQALFVWRDIVGLAVIEQGEKRALLGAAGRALVELVADAKGPVDQHAAGLYHIALHVPHRWALAAVVSRAMSARWRHSTPDHIYTETCYLWDADGNGIEITFETPHRGRFNPDFPTRSNIPMIDADGNPRSGRDPLDLRGLLAELEGTGGKAPPMPEGTRVGHVHLSMDDLRPATVFYNQVLGFNGLVAAPQMGMVDFKTDYVPHIVALNNWLAPVQPRRLGAAGLRHFTIELPDQTALAGLQTRLRSAGAPLDETLGGLVTADPVGNRIALMVRATN